MSGRLRTIDGLRGVAALAVVLYHLDLAAALAFEAWRPTGAVRWILDHGYLGVDVFFVLSGFVIPYSVSRMAPSLGFIGRFALRRSLRLDPPYWAAIALEVGAVWLALRVGLAESPLPTWSQIWSHLFYAQNVIGHGDILIIFWTLCFEIQFYLGFVLLVVTWRSIGSPKRLAAVALAALYLCSVLGRYDIGLSIAPWLALERWYQFFLGTLTFWLVSGRISWRPLAGAWTVLPLVVATGEARPVDMIPVVMSALLWAAHARDGMQTWLASRTWQFLGTISYSLYLFHLIFGWRWIRVVGRVVGPDAPGAVAFGAFLSGVAVSVLSAWAMWRLVEVPSLALSRSVSMAGRAAPKLDPATDREDALMPERPRP